MQPHSNKPTTHFTGAADQKKYHQGLRSMLNPGQEGEGLLKQQEQKQQPSSWMSSKQTTSQQQQAAARKSSSGSFSDDDLAALPVEKQFETDYDQTGHLVPDAVHFGQDQDMVGASNDEFCEHLGTRGSDPMGMRGGDPMGMRGSGHMGM